MTTIEIIWLIVRIAAIFAGGVLAWTYMKEFIYTRRLGYLALVLLATMCTASCIICLQLEGWL